MDMLENVSARFQPVMAKVDFETREKIANLLIIYFALFIAVWVMLAKRWRYWQLGRIPASTPPPYGMPGVPLLLALSPIHKGFVIPFVLVFSAALDRFGSLRHSPFNLLGCSSIRKAVQ